MKAWSALTLSIVMAVAVANVVHVARHIPPSPLVASAATMDPVRRQEQRFTAVRRSVQERGLRGVIGYVGDLPAAPLMQDHRSVEDYYLAQFALVPLVLDLDPAPHGWAVANLRAAAPDTRLPAGFRLEQDFGDGVLLLKKAAP